MPEIHETPDGLTFRKWTPAWLRITLLLAGLLTLLAPYELLLVPGLRPSLAAIVPLLISLVAMGLGAVCVWIALIAPSESLRLDARSRRMSHAGSNGRPFQAVYPFEAIAEMALVVQDWETRADTWRIEFRLANGTRIQTPDFRDRAEAEAYLDRLRAMVRADDA